MMEKSTSTELTELRKELDEIDAELIKLLNKRFLKSKLIGILKKRLSISSYTPVREKEILNSIDESVVDSEIKKHIKSVFERIIDQSRAIQRNSIPQD